MKTVIRTSRLWRKRTTLKRCRTLESVFAGIALFSLVSGLAADICNTTECQRTASTVLGKMNTEIRPCDDFYQFACGSFINKTQLGENKDFIDTLSEMNDGVQEQMLAVMQERRPETDPKYLQLPNILYRACSNTGLIEKLGPKPMQQIANVLGGWPGSDSCRRDPNSSWYWLNIVQKMRDLGFVSTHIMRLLIEKHPNNPNKHIIALRRPFVGEFSVRNGFSDPSVSAYYDYMVDIAVLFKADRETAKKALRKSLEFEISLEKIFSMSRNNLRSIKEIQVLYPYVNWLDYINYGLPEDQTVTEDEIINVPSLRYFEKLGILLQSTDNCTIADYLMWKMHEHVVGFLSQEFRTRKSQFETILRKKGIRVPETENCFNMVLSRLPKATDTLFLRKYLKRDTKPDVLEMINNIRTAFSGMLDTTPWMDPETKRRSKNRLNLINIFIGYTTELLNDTFLEEHFRTLNMDPDKYFESSLNISVFNTDESFSQLKFPVNASNWKIYKRPRDLDISYSEKKNSLEYGAGSLLGHIFDSEHPNYMNYGRIGNCIGHEFTHSVLGEYSRIFNWWLTETREAYKEKAKCVIDQYANQTGLRVSGYFAPEEKVCDHGGTKSSYLAYNKWVAQNGEEQKLPGLNYTSRQMFWIAAAQIQCAKYRDNSIRRRMLNQKGTLPEFQILGTFRNMKYFSRDFQCANGTSMNPVKKCDVW